MSSQEVTRLLEAIRVALVTDGIALDSEKTDDAAFTPGTSKVLMFGATFDDTAPDSVNEGDAGAVRMSARRELYVQLRDAAGNERGLNIDASGNLGLAADPFGLNADVASATGSISAKLRSIAAAVEILDNAISGSEMQVDVVAALPAGDNNIGNMDIVTVPADPFGLNADAASATGSISAKLRQIAVTGIPITGTVTVAAHAVTNAGTFATQVDGAALTALNLIDDAIFADEAAFTPATSKVMAVGYMADETSPDSAAEGTIGAARMTLDRQVRVASEIQSTTIDDYETVAASQTAQALGATGATGDYIVGILVVPATTSPGNVLLLDNATSITVFVGGASSVSNLVPFFIPIGAKSVSGAWKITTGANVSCIGIGKFT